MKSKESFPQFHARLVTTSSPKANWDDEQKSETIAKMLNLKRVLEKSYHISIALKDIRLGKLFSELRKPKNKQVVFR